MSKVIAIARDHVALELALSGIQVHRVSDMKEAEDLLGEVLESDADLLLLQEEIRDGLSEFARNNLMRHKGDPLVVYCPSFEDEHSDVDAYLSTIIKPAVGYEIRLD